MKKQPASPREPVLRAKAVRLARHKQTQCWLLLTPKELRHLAEGDALPALRRQAQHILKSWEMP